MTLPFGNPGFMGGRGIIASRYLIAAGGGGGGDNTHVAGAPGGAGGLKEGFSLDLMPGAYSVLIGAGGTQKAKGGFSRLTGPLGIVLEVIGGGAGRQGGAGSDADMNGGSGAGGPSGGLYPGGSGIPGQGYDGGESTPAGSIRVGGGGGADGPGGDGNGLPGPGRVSNITGANKTYSRGGGLSGITPGPTDYGWGAMGRPGSPTTSPGHSGIQGVFHLWYPGLPLAVGGTISTVNNGTLHTFLSNGPLVVW